MPENPTFPSQPVTPESPSGDPHRPPLLEAACWGAIVALGGLIVVAIWCVAQMPRSSVHFHWFSLMLPYQWAETIAVVLFQLVAIATVLQLRRGQYWAWLVVQALGAMAVIWSMGHAAAALDYDPSRTDTTAYLWLATNPFLVTWGAVESLVIAVCMIGLYRPAVQAFCIVGKDE